MQTRTSKPYIIKLENKLTLQDLSDICSQGIQSQKYELDEKLLKEIDANHAFLMNAIEAGQHDIYGATTGFGSSSANRISVDQALQMQKNLYEYHGCGTGAYLTEEECAAAMLVRLNCFSYARSGISVGLLEKMVELMNHGVFPCIPSRGSVGASGDLTPLSYIAAALHGKRHVYFKNEVRQTAEVFAELGIQPYVFKMRESLAIMNGSSIMSTVAAKAWITLDKVYSAATFNIAMMLDLLDLQKSAFHPLVHQVKPHSGQLAVAKLFESIFPQDMQLQAIRKEGEIQDKYSIRCSPQILGAFQDALTWTKTLIEQEMNSVNDNPLFFHKENKILNGGNFFGGHIAMACDTLNAGLGSVINLIDRQIAYMMSTACHDKLSENLVDPGLEEPIRKINHGYKAMQITLSALTAEIIHSTNPAAVLSRPTESGNQDVVSMGSVAATNLSKQAHLAEDCLAIHTLTLLQAHYVRRQKNAEVRYAPKIQNILETFASQFQPVIHDRALDQDIVRMKTTLFEKCEWTSWR